MTEAERQLDAAENALLESKSQLGASLHALYDIRNASCRAIRAIHDRMGDEDPTETKIKEGSLGAGRAAKVVGPPVWIEQWWVAVLFDDEEDPEFFKAACLEGFDRLISVIPKKT